MSSPNSGSAYALGYTKAESERLIRQATQLAPLTERFFRDAGIASGQRVLELGSGMGDVAMLVARLVGPSGSVLGIERDADSIRFAQTRIAEAGLRNVSFSQNEISQLHAEKQFDAAVGRFILQFLPDPVSVLRSLSAAVRPGGVIAFHEPQWQPYIDLLANLPLSRACAIAVRDTMHASGVRTDSGLSLHHVFLEAGLPAPNMRIEMILGSQPGFTTWVCDLLASLLPKARQYKIPLNALGDFETLSTRVHAEVAAANVVVPWIALVAAWSVAP
jgi:2-polyprenyl-3-methyl-5-hydroxy-6-metoxy-1,4-benzoquinol methylase